MISQDKEDYNDKRAQMLQLPRLGLGKAQGFARMEEKLSSHEDDPNIIVLAQQLESVPEPDNAAPLAPEPEGAPPFLQVVFDTDGDKRKVIILKRPLGAEFSKRRSGPTKVSYVDPQSYAEELGLEVGWVIETIAGVDMRGKTFQETQVAIRDGLVSLPTDRA